MIVIYAKKKDEFVNDVIDYLQNEAFFRISKDNGFRYIESFFDNDNSSSKSLVKNNYTDKTNIDRLTSVWFNGGTYNLDSIQSMNSNELNHLLHENYNFVLDGILENKKKLGNINNNKKSNKIYNLLVAEGVGLTIPKSLITTKKDSLLSFVNNHLDSGIICKRINDSDSFSEGDYLYDGSKTILMTNEILDKLPNDFGLSFFQERIIKNFEIRSIFFDNKFYSAAIFDKENNLDYREGLQDSNNKPRIVPYILPKKVEVKLMELLNTINYSYCSIDLIYSTEGEYVFLEINPCGQISYVNNACNYYLEEKVAQYLKN